MEAALDSKGAVECRLGQVDGDDESEEEQMLVTPAELRERNRRIEGLRNMLRSLGVVILTFSLTLIQEDVREVILEDWYGLSLDGSRVDLALMPLSGYYVAELCFIVRRDHESIFGQWDWYLCEDRVYVVAI